MNDKDSAVSWWGSLTNKQKMYYVSATLWLVALCGVAVMVFGFASLHLSTIAAGGMIVLGAGIIGGHFEGFMGW